MKPFTLEYSTSSAFTQMSVYHCARIFFLAGDKPARASCYLFAILFILPRPCAKRCAFARAKSAPSAWQPFSQEAGLFTKSVVLRVAVRHTTSPTVRGALNGVVRHLDVKLVLQRHHHMSTMWRAVGLKIAHDVAVREYSFPGQCQLLRQPMRRFVNASILVVRLFAVVSYTRTARSLCNCRAAPARCAALSFISCHAHLSSCFFPVRGQLFCENF